MCERAECVFSACIEQRDDYIKLCAKNTDEYWEDFSSAGEITLTNYLGDSETFQGTGL